MNGPTRLLERVTRVAPLGIRFRDAATGAVVDDGLVVSAFPSASAVEPVSALCNGAGVYVFHNLQGLRLAENGEGDAGYWAAPQPKTAYVIDVVDAA